MTNHKAKPINLVAEERQLIGCMFGSVTSILTLLVKKSSSNRKL